MNSSLAKKWTDIVDRHRQSVERFAITAENIDSERWLVPIDVGKWSPAQITQHVVQTYEVMTHQLRTGEGLQVQTDWFVRQVLRVTVLRFIMWFRRIPAGAKAPRVLRPSDTTLDQTALVARLRAITSEFETELLDRREQKNLQLTHHIFGSVDGRKALDFIAVHTEHHGRQLASCAVSKRSA